MGRGGRCWSLTMDRDSAGVLNKQWERPQRSHFQHFREIPICLRHLKFYVTNPKQLQQSPTSLCNSGGSFSEQILQELPRRSQPPSSSPVLPLQHHLITIWSLASSIAASSGRHCASVVKHHFIHHCLPSCLSCLPGIVPAPPKKPPSH